MVRRAVERDAADIVEYCNIVGGETDFLSYGSNEYAHNIEEQRQIIHEYNDSRNRLFIVAEVDGKICGILTFWGNNRRRLEHWGELGISVLKAYWNKGAGSFMMKYLLKWANDGRTVKKLDLLVREDNIPAIELYRKMGFEIEGKVTKAMKIAGRYYDFLYMGKFIE
jgi:RimJ/RimL family protein N-acetyltransferase